MYLTKAMSQYCKTKKILSLNCLPILSVLLTFFSCTPKLDFDDKSNGSCAVLIATLQMSLVYGTVTNSKQNNICFVS